MRNGIGPAIGTTALLLMGVVAIAQTRQTAPSFSAVVNAVLDMENRFAEVRRSGDRAAYAKLIAPEFTRTNPNGQVTGRDEELARINPATAGSTAATEVTDRKVLAYGDTALAISVSHFADGRAVRQVRAWHRTDAGWQIVFYQGTQVSPATK
jgi:hypothetical protein